MLTGQSLPKSWKWHLWSQKVCSGVEASLLTHFCFDFWAFQMNWIWVRPFKWWDALKKTNRQKLQKQHVYKIKTSSCSQTLSHCEVAGTHGWLQASLLLFTPFFFFGRTKGGRQLDFHRRREYNKKKNWLIFLFPHNLRIKAAAASHIQPTQPWARILWLRCLLPFQTHCIDVDTNKRRRLQIHFMIYGSTFALFEWVSNISATNFLPVWECVIVKTRMRRFDKTRSPKIAQR